MSIKCSQVVMWSVIKKDILECFFPLQSTVSAHILCQTATDWRSNKCCKIVSEKKKKSIFQPHSNKIKNIPSMCQCKKMWFRDLYNSVMGSLTKTFSTSRLQLQVQQQVLKHPDILTCQNCFFSSSCPSDISLSSVTLMTSHCLVFLLIVYFWDG